MRKKSYFQMVAVLTTSVLYTNLCFAQGYQPPTSKELYESNGEPGEALKSPSGLFLGANMGFGQSRHAGGSENPTASFQGSAEIGYTLGTGSWSRVEVGAEGFIGSIGNASVDMPVKGILAKIGHGHSLGNKIVGIWKLGAGISQADYSTEVNNVKIKAKNPAFGLVVQGSYSVLVPMASYFSVIGGLKISHYQYNFDKFRANGNEFSDKTTMVLNVPEISVGLRVGI